MRLAVREPGSGARRLLERELRHAGLPAALAGRSRTVATGHGDVASAIALGAADVGVASRDVAAARGLHFVPLAAERYDLVVPAGLGQDARVERLLETLAAAAFRRDLSALGYDTRASGTRVAELGPEAPRPSATTVKPH